MRISKSRMNIKLVALFSLSLLGFYFLNLYTHIALDDFFYKFIINLNKTAEVRGVRVESISDLLISTYNHYFVQNGRILLNGLAQLFLMPDNKLWFNLANTLVFGLFQFLILKRSTALNFKSGYQYLLLLIFLWFIIPGPNHAYLWLDGAMNYMWGLTIVLLFLDFFDRISSKILPVKKRYLPLLLILGFLSGFTHEVVTIGVSGAFCLQLVRKFKSYKITSLVLIFGFLLGTFLMVVAPSHMIRFNNYSPENYTIFDMLIKRCYGFIMNLESLSAFWIMILLFTILYVKDRNSFKNVYKEHELLVHSIFISLGFIFAVGVIGPRVFFGVAVFSIIIIFSIVNKYSQLFFSPKKKIIYIILSVLVIIEFTQVTSELRANKIAFDRDEENWLRSNENVFELRKEHINRFSIIEPGVKGDRYSWSNKYLSWLYGNEFMMFIASELYQSVYKTDKLFEDKNLLNTASFKRASEGVKFYKTQEDDFLLYKIPDSISEKFQEGAQVKYKANRFFKYNTAGPLKRFLGVDELRNIGTEMKVCFVLPTTHGNYLVLNSPMFLPFENLEEILIYPSKNDTIPILSF